ncbi:penicillin-binding protein [Penicillium herquei]|nr:penicillin-binding protein [Penicillium herquei]
MLLFLLVGVMILASHLSVVTQNQLGRTPFTSEFDKNIRSILDNFDIPGLAISVVQHENVFFRGYGVSDIDTLQPVSEHTLFLTGSTTKAFTAAAISLLVDDSQNYPNIQWDTPVHSIIANDFSMIDPWYTDHVTLRDILSHRSGLPRHDWLLLANLTSQDIIQRIRHLPLTAEIRTIFQYNNLMYIVAAHILETVSGQSLQSLFIDRIWGPLNMTETYISMTDAQEAGRDVSQGYYIDFQGRVTSTQHTNMENARGAGNILSSVNDYAKWISTLLHRGPPFSESAYRTFFCGHTIAHGESVPPFTSPLLYGMGWLLRDYLGEPVIQHTGFQYGFGSSVVLLPRRKIGFVIMGNHMRGIEAAADVIAYNIIDNFLGTPKHKQFDWAKRSGGGQAEEKFKSKTITTETLHELYPGMPKSPQPHPLNLSAYEGIFVHVAYPNLTISQDCESAERPPGDREWPGATLCAFLIDPGDSFPPPFSLNIYHVTGTSWALITGLAGEMSTARVEFRLDAEERTVIQMGAEVDSSMSRKGQKIWWNRV